MVKHCSLLKLVTKNQHHYYLPRVRCILQGSNTNPCSSNPCSLLLHCYLRPPEITHTQLKSYVIKSYLKWQNCHNKSELSVNIIRKAMFSIVPIMWGPPFNLLSDHEKVSTQNLDTSFNTQKIGTKINSCIFFVSKYFLF